MTELSVANVRPILLLQGTEQADMTLALQRLSVQLPIDGRAHAEITLVNWGRRDGETGFQWLSIALGDAVGVAFLDAATRVFEGEVTAIEERYGEGAPLLVLLIEDRLHRLAKRRGSRVFESQGADDVINAVAAEHNLQADVAISGAAADWHQLNETDLNFLRRLTSRWGMALRLADGRLRARPEEDDPDPVAVSPQANAQHLRIVADLDHQAAGSGVRGWDFAGGDAVEDAADSLQPPVREGAAALLGRLGWGGEEWLTRPAARNAEEARAIAAGAFRRQAGRFLSGEILLQGDPRLRPGGEVTLAEVSPRIAGRYRVVHVCHRFDSANGFVSQVRVERPGWETS